MIHPGVEGLSLDTDILDIQAEVYIRVDCLGRTGISSELLGWDVLDELPQIFLGRASGHLDLGLRG